MTFSSEVCVRGLSGGWVEWFWLEDGSSQEQPREQKWPRRPPRQEANARTRNDGLGGQPWEHRGLVWEACPAEHYVPTEGMWEEAKWCYCNRYFIQVAKYSDNKHLDPGQANKIFIPDIPRSRPQLSSDRKIFPQSRAKFYHWQF